MRVVYELLLALEYLKRQHIVHCNLNTDHVWLVRGDHIKISGFGNSRQFFPQEQGDSSHRQFYSQRSMNGEPTLDRSYFDPFEADLHDAGLIFSELMYG